MKAILFVSLCILGSCLSLRLQKKTIFETTSVALYIASDATLEGSYAEGVVVVGGDLAIPDLFTVNTDGLSPLSLVVQGDIIIGGALHTTGSIEYEGTLSGTVYIDDGSAIEEPLCFFDFNAISSNAESLSTDYASLTPTGSSSKLYSTITVTCTIPGYDDDVQVINLPGSYFTPGFTLQFSGCSTNQTIFLNVDGTSVSISSGTIDYSSVNPSTVIFNLYQATSLVVSSIQFSHVTLAPFAAIYATNGQGGQFYANSIVSFDFQFTTDYFGEWIFTL